MRRLTRTPAHACLALALALAAALSHAQEQDSRPSALPKLENLNSFRQLAGFAPFHLVPPQETTAARGVPVPSEPNAGADITLNLVLQRLDEFAQGVQRYSLFPLDPRKAAIAAAKGIVASLEDPYSHFLDPQDRARFQAAVEGSFGGIGVLFDHKRSGKPAVVYAVLPGSPADQRLQPRDALLAIQEEKGEDRDTRRMNQDELDRSIQGPVGSRVDLLVERSGRRFHMDLECSRIETGNLFSKMLPGNVGYLYISGFRSGTAQSALSRIRQLQAHAGPAGLRRLILDLRFNPGGIVEEAAILAGEFLGGSRVIYSQRTRADQISGYAGYTRKALSYGEFDALPLVLLINQHSASASEIVAGALQDHGRARIVGSSVSHGKGVVQTGIFEWFDRLPAGHPLRGCGLVLSVAHWYTPNGRAIQKDAQGNGGIAPDPGLLVPVDKAQEYKLFRDMFTELNGMQQAPGRPGNPILKLFQKVFVEPDRSPQLAGRTADPVLEKALSLPDQTFGLRQSSQY